MTFQLVGQVVGAYFGGPIGSAIGGFIGAQIDASDRPKNAPPQVQASEYGRPIPIIYGTPPIVGDVIWASELVQTGDGGGKGGSPQIDGPTYSANFALLLGEYRDGLQLGRIWAGPDKRLIYDPASNHALESGTLRFYDGSEDQMPDPLMESYLGAGNVPAYRGSCYLVLEGFDVSSHDGNRIPFLTVEVGRVESWACPIPVTTVDGVSIFDPPPIKVADIPTANDYGRAFQDSTTGLVYWQYTTSAGDTYLGKVDPGTGVVEPSPLLLSGGTTGRIAWDGAGTAEYVDGTPNIVSVNLLDWTASIRQLQAVRGGSIFPVPFVDVAWSDKELRYVYLSADNQINWNFATPPQSAITDTNEGLAAGGYAYDVTGGSGGVRFGGSLLPIGANGVAASFNTQHANYASDVLAWDGYDSSRELLVSFTAGSYARLGPGGTFTNTANFDQLTASSVVYSPEQDLFYVKTSAGILIYDPSKLTPEGWEPEDCILLPTGVTQGYEDGEAIPGTPSRLIYLPEDPEYIGVITSGGDILKVRIGGVLDPQGELLSDVVSDLCIRAGLTAGQIDVTQLTDTVDGYAIANQMSVADAIKPLMTVYFFDAAEDQGKIKFVKRGGDIAEEIPDDDLGAHASDEDKSDLFETTKISDEELPQTLSVNYILEATKYSQASKYARKLVGFSGDEQRLDFAMVLTDQKAQEVANVNLHNAWVSRITRELSLGRKYSHLMPTDIIGVSGYAWRITQMTQKGGYFELDCVRDDSDTYTPRVIVTETPPAEESVNVPPLTLLELM
jgi:hypothetical protein